MSYDVLFFFKHMSLWCKLFLACLYDVVISLGLYDTEVSLGLYDTEVSLGLYDGNFGVF